MKFWLCDVVLMVMVGIVVVSVNDGLDVDV